MPMRVLYVHQDGQLSGSAISLRNIQCAFDRKKYQPQVLLAGEGPARQLYELLKIPAGRRAFEKMSKYTPEKFARDTLRAYEDPFSHS